MGNKGRLLWYGFDKAFRVFYTSVDMGKRTSRAFTCRHDNDLHGFHGNRSMVDMFASRIEARPSIIVIYLEMFWELFIQIQGPVWAL